MGRRPRPRPRGVRAGSRPLPLPRPSRPGCMGRYSARRRAGGQGVGRGGRRWWSWSSAAGLRSQPPEGLVPAALLLSCAGAGPPPRTPCRAWPLPRPPHTARHGTGPAAHPTQHAAALQRTTHRAQRSAQQAQRAYRHPTQSPRHPRSHPAGRPPQRRTPCPSHPPETGWERLFTDLFTNLREKSVGLQLILGRSSSVCVLFSPFWQQGAVQGEQPTPSRVPQDREFSIKSEKAMPPPQSWFT